MSIRIHPSILSADFANFESEFETLQGADALHIDVMDGHFVPNLTFGLPVVKRLVEVAKFETDIHLMIENVDVEAVKYAEIGANSVTFHWEASTQPIATARAIRAAGSRAAIAVKPGTDISLALDALNEFDMVLVMTVEPGFGGQKFMEDMIPKIEAARAEIARLALDVSIQVDGGIDRKTIASASDAGADCFVAGSSVFGSSDRAAEISLLREIATQHSHLV
jgi:ribulose-phosphate 3-epimerase